MARAVVRRHAAVVLFLRFRVPVLQECDWRGGLVQHCVDEETPIGGDVVLSSELDVGAAAENARRKEHHGRSRFQHGPVDVDRRRHHRAVGVDVDTEVTRYRKDGSLLGRFNSLYILTKEDGRWGIKVRSSFETLIK